MFGFSEKTPSYAQERAESFDWSTPQTNFGATSQTLDLDWSQPISTQKQDNLDLKWSDDEDSDSDVFDTGITMKKSPEEPAVPVIVEPNQANASLVESEQEPGRPDIMAQQLKFIACLKILMAEMATLATGFEVDGGQLRLQLYLWLDKELQVLLCYSTSENYIV